MQCRRRAQTGEGLLSPRKTLGYGGPAPAPNPWRIRMAANGKIHKTKTKINAQKFQNNKTKTKTSQVNQYNGGVVRFRVFSSCRPASAPTLPFPPHPPPLLAPFCCLFCLPPQFRSWLSSRKYIRQADRRPRQIKQQGVHKKKKRCLRQITSNPPSLSLIFQSFFVSPNGLTCP